MKVWFFGTPSESVRNVPTNICANFGACTPKCTKNFLCQPTIHDFHLCITSSSSFHGFNTTELIQRPAPCRLVSSIGRALHRYRRGQGLESLRSLIFFFLGFLSATAKVASIIATIFFHVKNKQLCIVGEVSLNINCRTVAFIFKVCRLSKAVSCTNYVVKKRREKRK